MSIPDNIQNLLQEECRRLSSYKQQESMLKSGVDATKGTLRELVREYGTADDKGNLLIELPEKIGNIARLKLERRVGRGFDEEMAEEILKGIVVDPGNEDDDDITLWDQCSEVVFQLDDDKVMAARYEGLLTDDQIDAIYPKNESFAFVTPAK